MRVACMLAPDETHSPVPGLHDQPPVRMPLVAGHMDATSSAVLPSDPVIVPVQTAGPPVGQVGPQAGCCGGGSGAGAVGDAGDVGDAHTSSPRCRHVFWTTFLQMRN